MFSVMTKVSLAMHMSASIDRTEVEINWHPTIVAAQWLCNNRR